MKLKSEWVKSETSDKKYFVREMPDGKWACSCPHFVFRGKVCKHIENVKTTIDNRPQSAILK